MGSGAGQRESLGGMVNGVVEWKDMLGKSVGGFFGKINFCLILVKYLGDLSARIGVLNIYKGLLGG